MWKRQIILFLCLLYVGDSLAKSIHQTDFDNDYRVSSRRHSSYRGRSVTTTPRPLLQRYWHSFVRNLPTLPPISWNITNPIGSLFNAGVQQTIKTPMTMHYVLEEPKKRKTSKRRYSKKNKNRKRSQSRNYYYNTFDNSYGNSYQQTQMKLIPLGVDQNRVMHFYEPASGQYYALQLESRPYYYNSPYGNQYNSPYFSQYGLHQSYGDNGSDGSSGEDGSYYSDNGFNSEHGYDSQESYDFDQEYNHEYNRYGSGYSSFDNKHGPNDEDNMEYDDGVELVDNWGYNDEEIFADRKLKGGLINYDTITDGIIKIQKQLLKPETEEDVKILLSKGQKLNNKKEITSTTKNEEQEVESVRSALNINTRIKDGSALKRKKQTSNTKQLRLVATAREKAKYYIFPAKFFIHKI